MTFLFLRIVYKFSFLLTYFLTRLCSMVFTITCHWARATSLWHASFNQSKKVYVESKSVDGDSTERWLCITGKMWWHVL